MDSDNKVEDISALQKLSQLKVLILEKGNIQNIGVLSQLKELEQLNLMDNPIRDFSPISKLPKVGVLVLRKTNISDLKFLKDMRSVEWLDLRDNKIKTLDLLKS